MCYIYKMGEDIQNSNINLFRSFIFAIVIFLILLFGGSFVYSHVEAWSFLDSIYFTVVTVTTIGYGDIVPQTITGKIFTMFFSFFGIAMAFYFFSIIGKYVYKRTFERKLKEHKRAIESKLEEHHDKLLKHLGKKSRKTIDTKGNK